jgi:putative ABC transport system substrate-binding protein
MRRREFITILGGAATLPLAAQAQQAEKKRISVLMSFAESDASARAMLEGYRKALAPLGWVEGKNLQTEVRWAAGSADRIKAFTKELFEFRPDAILVQGTVSTKSVVGATQSIPIVFVNVADPIGSGLVTNLAHPGGNVTGFMSDLSQQGGKWVTLLKEIAPGTTRLALLSNPETGPSLQLFLPSIEAAAFSSAIEIRVARVRAKEDIEGIVAAQAGAPGGALVITPAAFHTVHRDLIIELTARYRIPAVYYERAFADSGGLIAYAANYTEHFLGASAYIDRILKGAQAAELPVQISTKFDLVINAKAAKALGLAVPQTLLVAATDVIE